MGVFQIVLLCLGVVSAHNWLTSPSRGNAGGNFNGWTSPPCPQKGERVHVQVAAGQRFPIEWASGHGYGSYTYFVVLDAKDESNMISHTLESLDAYLAKAPSLNYMTDTWAMHSSPPPASAPWAASLNPTPVTSTFWTGGRPQSFRQYANPVEVHNKTTSAIGADKRAKYTNPDMPWIISVHKFALHEDKPEEMDMALMEIPAGSASGQYVVQYLWNGYYDCVDVNVLASQSTDVFGKSSSDTSLDRIDHCVFNMTATGFTVQSGAMELKQGDTPTGCLQACASSNDVYSGCTGVQISPVVLPSTAKYPGMYQSGTSHLPLTPSSTNSIAAGMGSASSVCYPVRVGAAPIVGPPYKVVSDPEDPVFYSTCYRKKPGWVFDQTCAACKPPVLKVTNKFGFTNRSCVTCRDMTTNQSPMVTPFWVLDNTCFACDGTLG